MLKTKSFQVEADSSDGKRVSIMRSHLLPGTLQTDSQMTPETYDEWQPKLSPPSSLLRAYQRDEIAWGTFSRQYQQYVCHPLNSVRLQNLAVSALENTVTLLSKQLEPERSCRSLLANIVHVYYPDVTVHID